MSPLSIENVMTLVITGARDGSKNPLKPSANPSPPPTIRPSTGFDMLIVASGENLFRARVRLHYTEKISFRVQTISEITDCRNRSFRHCQGASGFCNRGNGIVHGVDSDRVRRGFHVAALHDSTVNSRYFVVARVDHPVVHRSGPLFDPPAEHILVEGRGAVRIVHWDFK